MEVNKKIYKYISIISFTVVIMLIVNMIIPIFTKADTGDNITLNIQNGDKENSLTVTGAVPLETSSYKLYWIKGTIPYEMPGATATDQEKIQYQKDLENWCESNNIQKEENDTSLQINSTIELTGDGTYNVVCIVYLNDNTIMLAKAEKTITSGDTTSFTLEAESTNKKITINANSASNIVDIRVKKIDNLEDKDFDNCSNILAENEHVATIAKEYTVNDYGAYKIKATNESGQSKYITIPVCEEGKGVVINATAENNKININVTSVILNIKTLKIVKSDKDLTWEELDENGEPITFTEGKNVTVSKDVTEAGNYYIYAKDELGVAAKFGPITIGNSNPNSDDKEVDVTIELYRKNGDDAKTMHVKASSETSNIAFLKYYISSEPLPTEDKDKNIETLKNSQYTIECNNAKSVIKEFTDSSISDDKYIYIYAETSSGACYYIGKDIKSIEYVDTIPGEEEEIPDEGEGNEGNKPGDDKTTGDETGGNEQGDDKTTGDEAGGNESGDDKTAGDETEGNKPRDDKTTGDEAGGNKPGDDKTTGDEAGGNKPGDDKTTGDEAEGNKPGDDKTAGDGAEGNKPGDNNTTGDNAEGNNKEGNNKEGNTPAGNNQTGNVNDGGTAGEKEPQTNEPSNENTSQGGNKTSTGTPTSNQPNTTNTVNTNNKVDNNVITQPIDEDIPQTGGNDTFIISMILIFSVISFGSYIKYRKMK